MNARIATIAVCVVAAAILALRPPQVVNASANQVRDARIVALGRGNQPPKTSEMATISALPTLGRGAEALAVNDAGTVIVGSAWDRDDLLHGVTWTLQNGKWVITALPTPPDATSAIARGAGTTGAGGNDFGTSRAIFWPWTGSFQILGCNDDLGGLTTVDGISGDGQIVVGQERSSGATSVRAAVWPTSPGSCRVDLPPLAAGLSAGAHAVNGDGTLVGGSSNGFPVRWTLSSGQWQIAQLDTRVGWAAGANAVGDLAGNVEVPDGTAGCTLPDGCQRAVIWYAQGGALQLDTLGGAHSWARDINASGEVVGLSTSPQAGNTGFFWSPSLGMYQLPFKGQFAGAHALSDVRPDGTRVVVGMNSQAVPVVWVVRNP